MIWNETLIKNMMGRIKALAGAKFSVSVPRPVRTQFTFIFIK